MRKPKADRFDVEGWGDVLSRESQRELAQKEIDAVLGFLEERKIVKRQHGYADSTEEFRRLFARAVRSLRKNHMPKPSDDPQSLIGLEMARLVLSITPSRIEKGSADPAELGRLSNVLTGFVRYYFKEQETKNLMELLIGRD
jgi:hypothetical protein